MQHLIAPFPVFLQWLSVTIVSTKLKNHWIDLCILILYISNSGLQTHYIRLAWEQHKAKYTLFLILTFF